MSRRYRRNGTPIGKHRVYALTLDFSGAKVYEIMPQGIETYEDLEGLVELEAMSGRFGTDYDRLVLLQPGVEILNSMLSRIDIRGADLHGAMLSGSTLVSADLRGVNLQGAVLRGCDLTHADISGTDFRFANLNGVFRLHGSVPDGWVRDKDWLLRRALRLCGTGWYNGGHHVHLRLHLVHVQVPRSRPVAHPLRR